MPRQRCRTGSLDVAGRKFWWEGEGPLGAYGLWQLSDWRSRGFPDLLLVEGESDSLTAWHHGLPCLGIPGNTQCETLQALHLEGFARVLLVKEPGKGGATFEAGGVSQLAALNFDGRALVLEM